jgi:tail tube protein
MAGYSSQAGSIAFMTQAAPDTFPATFDTVSRAMKLRSGSLTPNRELLVTDPEIGGGRDTVDAYLGAVSWAGDLEFYARLEVLCTLLKAAFGTGVPVTVTGVTTHTFTPADTATLPFLSVQEDIGGGLEKYNYTDAVVNTLHFECDANGYLMGTVGLIARKQIAGITKDTTLNFDDTFMIVGTNITITYGGVSVPAKSFSFDMTNNFEDDDFRLGSFYLGGLVAKSREFTGSFTIRPEDALLWRSAVYGASGLTAPGGLTNKQALVITCQTYEDIVAGTPPTKEQIVFTLPKVALEPYGLEPSGDDIIENDISWRGLRPVQGTPACTIVIKNALATIA